MIWESSSGKIALHLTKDQVLSASHSGSCDMDVDALLQDEGIRKQFRSIKPSLITQELKEFGAWNDKELSDRLQNKKRLLWIASNDLADYMTGKP